MSPPITEHVVKTDRHTTAYLACGPADGPLLIFVHGWPELAISWRHQLPVFGALGFRAVAPDMRGYGRSRVHPAPADYALRELTADMIELIDALGAERAVWIGHDWGSPVVWSVASHHPERCHAVASLCVPHVPDGFSPDNLIKLVDRALYPEAEFPAGQWDYMRYYEENLQAATAAFDSQVDRVVRLLFRKGDASGAGRPAATSMTRRFGGWFPGGEAPDFPRDPDVLTEQDEAAYVAALTRNGFHGPDSWYVNGPLNQAFAAQAPAARRIDMPVLFLHAAYDFVCATVGTALADPMRGACPDLTEAVVNSGHWMAQEAPLAVNAHLTRWLATRVAGIWPGA